LESLEDKIQRVTQEPVALEDYTPDWPKLFKQEKLHILDSLPDYLIISIKHIGSTAVPGMVAKPIVDMLLEISDEERGKELIPALLEPQGYDCFWRPSFGEDVPPWYTWCIRRDPAGVRTHHLHFVEPGVKDDMVRFRDILRSRPQVAEQYTRLKKNILREHGADRVAYTAAKGAFIKSIIAT
jgi:GrpB-like predicted nucleotidyltransferase (UPF0157 family)